MRGTNSKRLVISDLDGTLRRGDGTYNRADLEVLVELGKRGVPRVVATGRTVYSVREIMPPGFPIDYLVFSSGAGIQRWESRELLRTHHLSPQEISHISDLLISRGLDFMLHEPIPDNHRFLFHHSGGDNPDFHRRCAKHTRFSRAWADSGPLSLATQFLVVAPPSPEAPLHHELTQALPGFSVIRATSPLDGKSLWLEIFSRSVAKSLACQWVAEREGVARESSVAVGNDYNDVDLLEWAGASFVVANAPSDLKSRFTVVSSFEEAGFAEAVRQSGILPA